MTEFKFDGFLYVSMEGVNNIAMLETDVEKMLNLKFDSLEIEYQEAREDVEELAVKFNVIVESETAEQAETLVLSTLDGSDVDNYTVEEL